MKLTGAQRFDIAVAVVLALVGAVGTIGAGAADAAARTVDVTAVAMVVISALLLVVRRRWPAATLVAVAVLTMAYLVLEYPYGPVFFPFFVAVYTVARNLPVTAAAGWSLLALAVVIPHVFFHPGAVPGFVGLVPATAWVVVPFAVGVTVRLTREAREREQAERLRKGIDEERLRIAQEVHDVVGHGLAAIKMQADVALHVLAKQPDQAERALQAISRTSNEALDEVRATLGTVRRRDLGPDRSPAPGLRHLDDLVKRMTDAGVEVDVDTAGTPRELSAAADLAGYRLLQESLTNVLKHSERKAASVRVTYDDDAVRIIVSNPVPGGVVRDGGSAGLGIGGMTERVSALGGELAAGPTGDGRFEVRASIPMGGRP